MGTYPRMRKQRVSTVRGGSEGGVIKTVFHLDPTGAEAPPSNYVLVLDLTKRKKEQAGE